MSAACQIAEFHKVCTHAGDGRLHHSAEITCLLSHCRAVMLQIVSMLAEMMPDSLIEYRLKDHRRVKIVILAKTRSDPLRLMSLDPPRWFELVGEPGSRYPSRMGDGALGGVVSRRCQYTGWLSLDLVLSLGPDEAQPSGSEFAPLISSHQSKTRWLTARHLLN